MRNENVKELLQTIMWDIKHDPQGSIGEAIMAVGYALHAMGNGNMVPTRIMSPGAFSSVYNESTFLEDDEFEHAREFDNMVMNGEATAGDLQYYLLILDRMFNTIPENRRY